MPGGQEQAIPDNPFGFLVMPGNSRGESAGLPVTEQRERIWQKVAPVSVPANKRQSDEEAWPDARIEHHTH